MKTNNKGFTLIEVIVSMILVGIVVSVIFMPINFSFLNHGSLHEKAYIMSDTRYAMDYLTRQIRQSSQVEVTGNKIRTDSGVYGQEEGSLVKYNHKDDDRGEIVAEGIDQLTINKEGNEIIITIGAKDSKGKAYGLSSTIIIR
ncbi:MAG: PilW family protein [Anaerovoracaceae bacterium]